MDVESGIGLAAVAGAGAAVLFPPVRRAWVSWAARFAAPYVFLVVVVAGLAILNPPWMPDGVRGWVAWAERGAHPVLPPSFPRAFLWGGGAAVLAALAAPFLVLGDLAARGKPPGPGAVAAEGLSRALDASDPPPD